jgi:SsrA-binding protein
MKEDASRIVCRNKKAFHLYKIEERIEAGLVLSGSEVKSLRARNADLSDAYAAIKEGELFLHKAHIAEYSHAGYGGHEPKRTRKLLLRKHEIRRLRGKLVERGYTLVPLSIYFKEGWAKIELGLAKGKRKFDRRKAIQDKDHRKAMRKERDY